MTLSTSFGPVSAIWYNPTYDQAAYADGVSDVRIGGALPVAAAQALFELVNNRSNRTTRQGRTGVLEFLSSPYPVIAAFNGWYLFQAFTFTPYRFAAGTKAVDFTLTAAYLGAPA